MHINSVFIFVFVFYANIIECLLELHSNDDIDNLLVSPKVLNFGKERNKRSVEEDEIQKQLFQSDITALEVDDWIFLLKENDHLTFHADYKEIWSNDTDDDVVNCKFYNGNLINEIESLAIVTICDGKFYYGFFNTYGKSYFMEPTVLPSDGHVVYKSKLNKLKRKRCVEGCEGVEGFNLTGDTLMDDVNFNFADEDVDDVKFSFEEDDVAEGKMKKQLYKGRGKYEEGEDGKVVKRFRKHDDDELGYFVDAEWQSRPLKSADGGKTNMQNRESWLELALAVDYTVINFHGKDKIRQYIMALLNIVSVIYKDPSLDANIHLVLARLIFFEDKSESQIKPGNAKKSLEAVNRWNYRLVTKLPKDEKPHDVAVWLTREYLGGPSGYAPVAGVCDKARSTALNKDEGLASAFIIAHEVAHILGLTHDGDSKAGNDCNEVQGGTIMAPTVTATFHRFSWSTCSKKEFHKIIKRWTCLANPPKGKNHIILNAEITHTFTMDEQCRMEYGDGFSSCSSLPLIEPCTHLWCGHENSSLYCITKKGPPVEGTQCGFDKWCIDGYCQTVDGRLSTKIKTPRPGGWGPWSPWSECSRTCSYGVRRRLRRCDSPEPEEGGEPCAGPEDEVEVCKNKKKCWETPFSDMKASMCSKLVTSNEDFDFWLPYESEYDDGNCQMSCIYWKTGEIKKSDENIPDGVPCTYENQHHICVDGKCKKLGCEGVENSTLLEDSCGQCGGSGTSCDKSVYVFRRPLKKEMTRLTVLRRFSRTISMDINLVSRESNQIMIDSKIHLAVKDQSKTYNLMAKDDSIVQNLRSEPEPLNLIRGLAESSIVLAGALIKTSRTEGTFHLTATGPLNTDIVILVYSPVEYLNTIEAFIDLNYTLPYSSLRLNARASGRYKWIPGECQCDDYPVEPICVDTLWKNQTVSNKLCPNELKSNYVKSCSSARCHYHWVVGEWEQCSVTCGRNGTSHRQVYCVPRWINETESIERIWNYMVEPDKCVDIKPEQDKPCNRITCPAYWVEGPWTPCASTCGYEISHRTFQCSSEEKDACGSRPLFIWRKCGGNCEQQVCRDKSPYCSLELISRYCNIPEFKKLCCISCLNE